MKQNKNLIILLLVAVIGIVGVTIAYFSSRATFENVFETPEYGTTYIEKFTSPDNWLPGDVTEKTLEVRNSGNVDEAVRVKVEESWVSKRGTTLPLTQGNNAVALINFRNEDDWTKVTVDGENYYYYYYNYKLAPEETTSKLLDKVTFNPLISATTSCSDTVVDGVTTRTCSSNGTGYDGATYILKLTVETVQYNKYSEAWNTDIVVKEEKPNPLTIQDMISQKTNPVTITNYADGNIHEMYTFEHEATAQTPALTDYRYIGNDPYNYVYFNCDDLDNQNEETCEVWRIIGIFDVEREIDDEENPGQKKMITETRMKLVRGISLAAAIKWSQRSNDWTTATLNIFLNSDYYNGISDEGLKLSTIGLVDEAKYYLGASNYTGVSTEQLYADERGNKACALCDNTKLNLQEKVALMYPSDEYMVYGKNVNQLCYMYPTSCSEDKAKNGWIYNSNTVSRTNRISTWFISSLVNTGANILYDRGGLNNDLPSDRQGIRPVVYLSADVKIINGDGSIEHPYKLARP